LKASFEKTIAKEQQPVETVSADRSYFTGLESIGVIKQFSVVKEQQFQGENFAPQGSNIAPCRSR